LGSRSWKKGFIWLQAILSRVWLPKVGLFGETVEIAQDVARKLIESHIGHGDPLPEVARKSEKRINSER